MELNISVHTKLICIVLAVVLFPVYLLAQDKELSTPRTLTLSIADKNGKPLDEVGVTVGDGFAHAWSDASGKVEIIASNRDFIKVSKPGYDQEILPVNDIPGVITLKETSLYKSNNDEVHYPFLTHKKRNITGSGSVLKGSDLEGYPTSDLRNALVGLISGLDVIERSGNPSLSAFEKAEGADQISPKVDLNMRGYKPLFIVDGLEVDISEMPLDPQEIESVSVIKDIVSKTLYGPKAGDGVINITTKRGAQNERVVRARVESGMSIADRFPEWVSGAEYAQLNNQARINSGMEPLFSSDDIARYALNNPYDLAHPSIDFKEMLWKDTRPFLRANLSSSGGNNWVKYFAYLGYNHEGDNFKIGPTSNYNRINARSNLDINITSDLKVSMGIYGGVTIRNAPTYASLVTTVPEMESFLGDLTTIPPVEFPVYASKEEGADPWYAVSSRYSRNPVGDLQSCGYYSEMTRSSAANMALDYDLSKLLFGLRSHTFLTFNLLNITRIGKDNDYIAYTVTPSNAPGEDPLLTRVRDGIDNAEQSKMLDYYYQRLAFHQRLSYDRVIGDHEIRLGLIYSMFNGTKDSKREPDRQQNGIFSAMYGFQNKYFLEGAFNYAGTSSFEKDNRYDLFPALGLSWVISDEDFLKEVNFIDYLKLRLNGGILGYDGLATAFYYQDRWSKATLSPSFGPHSANQWFGSNTETVSRTYPNRIANYGLTWEKRKELSGGFDMLMLDRKLLFEFNYYNNIQDGVIGKMNYLLPYVTGYSTASPWHNKNKYRYCGTEFQLTYSGKIEDFNYKIGGNAAFHRSKVLKYDEPNYSQAYRSRVGHPTDVIMGYGYLGRYTSDAEAQAVIQTFDQTLLAGDLKYLDKNEDGVIDENDMYAIGHSSPKMIYGINISLEYKNIELNAVGSGRASYDIVKSNIYFRSGVGDNTYSKYVRDNIDGAYPRLTYQRINNNFQTSEYWLTDGSFFKLQNVELAYKLRLKNNITGVQMIRFHVSGANLLTLSELKDVDPESIDSGITTYPLFRTFTGGITMSF